MSTPDRRRFLAGLAAAGATALLAGCSDGSNGDAPTPSPTDPTPTATPTATPPPESRFVTDDGSIDYPGMVDGDATVNADGESYTITYANPRRGFRLDSGFQGETRPSELRVTRDMTADARAAFLAPVYDDAAGEFVYQAFANQAYVDYGEWHFVSVGDDEELTEQGEVPFRQVQGSVYAAGVSPGDIRRLFLVDQSSAEMRSSGSGSLSGIILLLSRERTPTPTSG